MEDIKYLTKTLEWIKDIVGKPGPMYLDIAILKHSYNEEEIRDLKIEFEESNFDEDSVDAEDVEAIQQIRNISDIIQIGYEGSIVTIDDCLSAIKNIDIWKDSAYKNASESGRGYFFEGISPKANVPNTYIINWGS